MAAFRLWTPKFRLTRIGFGRFAVYLVRFDEPQPAITATGWPDRLEEKRESFRKEAQLLAT